MLLFTHEWTSTARPFLTIPAPEAGYGLYLPVHILAPQGGGGHICPASSPTTGNCDYVERPSSVMFLILTSER